MKNKIFIILGIAVAGGAIIYFAYPAVKNRYFNQQEIKNVAPPVVPSEETAVLEQNESENEKSQENTENKMEDETSKANNNEFIKISSQDCDNECTSFTKESDLKYCQQVCGLIPTQNKESPGECNNLSGLEKDYCLKDLAIEKLDAGICEDIADKNIKKTCFNRITEEFLENQ